MSLTEEQYKQRYQQSIDQPQLFWAERAKQYLQWDKAWEQVLTGGLSGHNVRWFEGGQLNASVNCIDRHLSGKAEQTAIIWEGDEPGQIRTLSYAELHEQVCRLANALLKLGVGQGDRVCLYLPMIPEAAIAMLACARIGAVHSVVFAGFSAQALQSRIQDAECKLVITADESVRGGKTTTLKAHVDQALLECPLVEQVVVVKYSGQSIEWQPQRDHWYHEITAAASTDCQAVAMAATDPLFILYTSGSTGKPKGILHALGGYLLYATMSFQQVFDYQPGEVYWCSADVGWITGHSYIVYGPLASGATILMFAGTPTYPTPSRFWQVIDRHNVNIFYTAPTAIRALMCAGDDFVYKSSRQSLRLLGSVGEPINPEAWRWYYEVVGGSRCPIVDTWWQTETGGIMLTPFPGTATLKPGAASKPFFGVKPGIVNEQGDLQTGEADGHLVITQPWPGMLQTIYGDPQRFVDTYFSDYPGYYFSGDGARRDADGDYWITGRVDDVINVSGHRLGTAEIESALVAHPKVGEAAVVDYPHDVKGQGIYAFVTLLAEASPDPELRQELCQWVRKKIGPIATPDVIQWAEALPKTRSGKIMRRILRKIVHKDFDSLGDVSTLSNPEVVPILTEQCAKR